MESCRINWLTPSFPCILLLDISGSCGLLCFGNRMLCAHWVRCVLTGGSRLSLSKLKQVQSEEVRRLERKSPWTKGQGT